MPRLHGSRVRLGVLGVLSLAAAAPALAEQAVVLEEITVTAEKRISTVQETPISIAAFSGEELAIAGIDGTAALANYTPGLTIQKEVIGKVVIRGVGTENYTVGSDPGVAIHRDGAYIARSSVAMFDFFDINRVEVLRGPQGTLYGRNATGGVINILSNEPTDTVEGYAKVEVGNYSKRRFEAAVSAFFEAEAEELPLRTALQRAELYFDDTPEYREAESQAVGGVREFLREALPPETRELDFKARLVQTVVSSVAERLTNRGVKRSELRKWARVCSGMLCDYLGI